jgi:alanine racemase
LKTVLEINLQSLEYNFNKIKSLVKPTTKTMAVVKANGYGSDMIAVAKKLNKLGVDYFSVAYAKEGVELRNAGIKTPILVLIPQTGSFDEITNFDLEPSIYSFHFLNEFIKYTQKKNISNYPIHFKINSGLNRIGFKEEEIEKAFELVSNSNRFFIKSIYSHLSASEDLNEKEFTLKQIKSFEKSVEKIWPKLSHKPILHMSNTSGVVNYPESEFDMVRCGIGLYGFSNKLSVNLEPVHKLLSTISQIIDVSKGESVGYNRAYMAKEEIRVGVIPLGHADGISRSFNKGGYVVVNEKKCKIIGNVCMDVIMINLNDVAAKEGDQVVIFDEKNTAEEFADSVGTISYEILTNLSSRINRKIID